MQAAVFQAQFETITVLSRFAQRSAGLDEFLQENSSAKICHGVRCKFGEVLQALRAKPRFL